MSTGVYREALGAGEQGRVRPIFVARVQCKLIVAGAKGWHAPDNFEFCQVDRGLFEARRGITYNVHRGATFASRKGLGCPGRGYDSLTLKEDGISSRQYDKHSGRERRKSTKIP